MLFNIIFRIGLKVVREDGLLSFMCNRFLFNFYDISINFVEFSFINIVRSYIFVNVLICKGVV